MHLVEHMLPMAEQTRRVAREGPPAGQGGRKGHASAETAGLLCRFGEMEEELGRLRNEQREQRRALAEAGQMQRRLCGPRRLRHGHFEIAGELFPAEQLSGDFLAVFESGGDLVLAIGDIAGKGLAAGLWFTQIVGIIRLLVAGEEDPAAVLSSLNCELAKIEIETALTSVFLARLEPRSGTLTYSNAGHPPALVLQMDGASRRLEEGGPLLGVLPGAGYTSDQLRLQPGDLLLGFSDGISERTNEQGAEFGVDRIVEAAQCSRRVGASGVLFSILGAVSDFAATQKAQDDLALLVVQRAAEEVRPAD